MIYSYRSITHHSFKTVLLRHLPSLVMVAALTLLVKFYDNNEALKLEKWHVYSAFFVMIFSLFFILNDDFIEEVIFNTSTKKVEIIYYNIYQKQMRRVWEFEEFFSKIERSYKKEVAKIDFYRNKNLGFTLKKRKDNFSQESLNEINELLLELNLAKTK